MQIDHCLILAAGFGTRMGQIGKKLPKVLWPVFEKSLLELQVAYARYLGAKRIYINLHHMGVEIEEFCKGKAAFEDVIFLWEKPEILDIGGAIHNLASLTEVSYQGKLLVLNADQFFFIAKDDFINYLNVHSEARCLLFTYWVNTSLGYNGLEIDHQRNLLSIIKNKDLPPNKRIETYTGISFIDLAKLTPVHGVSSFFESVCPFTKAIIPTVLLENVDYWDFGTIKRYWETSFRILETYKVNSNHPFLRFLVQNKALKTWKINLQTISYHSITPRVINFSGEIISENINPSIILNDSNISKMSGERIWWNDLSEEVK
jgi:mannose-1-phosphate guanylyltransferase